MSMTHDTLGVIAWLGVLFCTVLGFGLIHDTNPLFRMQPLVGFCLYVLAVWLACYGINLITYHAWQMPA